MHLVQADAQRRLAGALKSKNPQRAGAALQEIVEASLPATRMPHERFRRAHPMASGPHRVWRWVFGSGLVNLVVEVLPDWQSVEAKLLLTRPGLGGTETVYRDVTTDLDGIDRLVSAAIRQLQHRLG